MPERSQAITSSLEPSTVVRADGAAAFLQGTASDLRASVNTRICVSRFWIEGRPEAMVRRVL